MTSSIYPRNGVVDSEIDIPLTIANAGTGYQIGDVIEFTPPPSGTTAEGIVDNVGGSGEITSTQVTISGPGYTSAPTATVISETGAGAIINVTGVSLNFGADENIFVNDVVITKADLRPGGGGVLRLYFSFNDTVSTTVKVFSNGNFKGLLNADNSNTITSDGYYRFDIDVEGGDGINLQATTEIDAINFVRMHLVNFGA